MSEAIPNVVPIEILLVEDNEVDVDLTRQALLENRVLNRLHVASDGEEAMDFLLRKGKHAKAPRPDLVLLDLNLPKLDGSEVLKRIKEDPKLKLIPVVVLTTSSAEQDIVKSYRLHANAFVTKPVDLDQFIKAVRATQTYWLTIVKLPGGGSAVPGLGR